MKRIPMRQCIGCMQQKEKNSLVRIARIAANQYVIDRTGKKNGRGAYICDAPECIELCMRRHGLDRAFAERVDGSAYEALYNELCTKVLDCDEEKGGTNNE